MSFRTTISALNLRTLAVLAYLCLGAGTATAQTITTATGGGAISADNTGGAYSTLTGPVYTEGANGDAGVGTIILNAPSGFEFDTGGTAPTVLVTRVAGNGGNNRNINDAGSGTSLAVTSVTATQITFTVTAASSNGVRNSLTWQDVRVRPTAGTPLASGNITKSGTSTMAGVSAGVTNFGTLSEVHGAHALLVVVLPGQSFTTGTGATGTPAVQTASTPFNISSIVAVDQFFNTATSYAGAKTLSYSGPGGSPVYTTNVSFTNGVSTTTLTTTLRKAETTSITVQEGAVSGPASTALTVQPGAFSKLQLLLPGETTDPGNAAGKTGSPSDQTAGISVPVIVNAVDDDWNLVSSTDIVRITSSDPNATLPADAALAGGTQVFNVILKTAGSWTMTAEDFSDGTKSPSTSPSVTVDPGAFEKLQILVPGETASPGTATGKTGSPSVQTAGTPFNATVNAVDAYWNVVTSTHTVQITSSDPNAVLPTDTALVAGTQTFAITAKTAGSSTVTASNVSDPTKSPASSPTITVQAGAFAKMQILVPGETANPGSATGKTGTPVAQTAGQLFQVTARAVDAQWNLVSSTHTVRITSSDGTASLPADAALVAGSQTFGVTLNTEGSATVTASNLTDSSKTADTSPSITVDPAGTGTLTPATGGEAISADDVGGTYTTLTGPIYDEGSSGNISAGTIILNAPSGFEFDTGGTAPTLLIVRIAGVGGDANNINGVPSGTAIGATSVTSTAVTFTITSPSAAGVQNSLTWQDLRVRPTSGAPLESGDITKSGTATIAGVTGAANFGTLTEVAGAFDMLVVTLPGQTFTAGSGNSGTPSAQTAGSPFNLVSLTATDQWLNIVTGYNGVKTVAYSGPGGEAQYTTSVNFTSGVSTTPLATTLKRAETTTITASEGAVTGPASSQLTVDPDALDRLQILVPGETADPGTTTGKTGTPTAQTAATPFNVTVNAVDQFYNPVSSTQTVRITTTDPNDVHPADAALVAGTRTFSVTFRTAGTATITAETLTPPSITADTSPMLAVNPGAFVKMQILVPGETADPGTATGKTGTPAAQAVGAPFTVTVNAVDADWNVVSSTNTVRITSSDGAASLPPDAALVAGTKDFVVTFNTAGSRTVTASNLSDGSKTASTSPSITVAAVVITSATGGSALSADDAGSVYTALTGPVYDEASSGDAGVGTVILNAPTGFEFDTGGTAPTVLITRLTGGGNASRNINGVVSGNSVAVTSVTSTQVTFTITSASNSGVTCRLTWQNIRVRPTAGTPLASGTISKSGTSTMTGAGPFTNFGTLTEVPGAHTYLVVTLPGETFTAGSGNSGTPTAQTAGEAFNLTGITATDQFLNVVPSYSGSKNVTFSGPSGSPSYPSSVNFTNGVADAPVSITLSDVETTTLSVDDGSVSGPPSSSLTVNAPVKTWDGGASTTSWGDAANWNPDGVPTSLNDVQLTGAQTIVVDVAASSKNLILNNAGLTLTIQAGASITVSGNYQHLNGTLNTENAFPSVSGSTTISGGSIGYTASGGGQSVAGLAYRTLVIGGGGTKTLAGNATVVDDLTINGGTLNLGAFSLNRTAPGGMLTLVSGAVLQAGGMSGGVSGSNFPDNFTSRTLDGLVEFNAAGNQTLPPYDFTDLTLSVSGTKAFPAGTVSIGGTLSVTGSAAPDFAVNSATVLYNGGLQAIMAGTYHSLVLTGGDKTFSGSVAVNNSFTNSAVTSAGVHAFSVSGVRTNSGTMRFAGETNGVVFGDGTVEYNGTSAQAPSGQVIAVGTYQNIVLSNSAAKHVTGGTVTVQTGVTVPTGVSLAVESDGTLAVLGNLDNQGAFSNDGIVTVGN